MTCSKPATVIFGSPRGGTSVVAAIFHAHGFDIEHWNHSDGYPTYENIGIKRWLKDHVKPTWGVPLEDTSLAPELAAYLDREFDGRIFNKCAIEYYPLFRAALPQMDAILVFREVEQAILSARKRTKRSTGEAEQIVRQRYAYMHTLPGWKVHSDRVVAGDFSQIERYFNFAGLVLDEEKARACVRPEIFTVRTG